MSAAPDTVITSGSQQTIVFNECQNLDSFLNYCQTQEPTLYKFLLYQLNKPEAYSHHAVCKAKDKKIKFFNHPLSINNQTIERKKDLIDFPMVSATFYQTHLEASLMSITAIVTLYVYPSHFLRLVLSVSTNKKTTLQQHPSRSISNLAFINYFHSIADLEAWTPDSNLLDLQRSSLIEVEQTTLEKKIISTSSIEMLVTGKHKI